MSIEGLRSAIEAREGNDKGNQDRIDNARAHLLKAEEEIRLGFLAIEQFDLDTIFFEYKGVKVSLRRLIEVNAEDMKNAEAENAEVEWNLGHKKKEVEGE